MFIKLLDKNLANMIAAGEVVERPASVVKELCENSVDAGAGVVTVEIAGGGLRFIKVTDNGCGIHPDDVESAFLRHATSKISKPEDLNNIYTLGFRGEALASIAAVAKVSLYTRCAAFETGVTCCANCGEITQSEETQGFIGTSIKVEDLFYTTPARLKFLKKDTTETGYVEETVRKTAIAHPEVSFRFIADGKEKLFTPGDSVLKNTVFTIYGKEAASQLFDINYSDGAVEVTGLAGNPVYTKKTRNMQMFFVNNRPVVNRMMSSALAEAYKGYIPGGVFPVGIIKLSVPANTVDINVHPAKLEVKFSDESRIYKAVYHGVRNALAKPVMPKIQYEKASTEETAVKSVYAQGKISAAVSEVNIEKIKPRSDEKFGRFVLNQTYSLKRNSVSGEENGYFMKAEAPKKSGYAPYTETLRTAAEKPVQLGIEVDKTADFQIIGQLFMTYILLEKENELILIDQHAAHEHITYARLKEQYDKREITSQQLLSPLIMRAEPLEIAYAAENGGFLKELGFDIEPFGNSDLAVRALPQAVNIDEVESLVQEIINAAMDKKQNLDTAVQERALFTIACRSSIKAGKRLTYEEMNNLAEQLFNIDKTVTCPHGRPAWAAMDKTFIEKQFKRLM